MKKFATVLVLLALFALVPAAQGLAAPAPAGPAASLSATDDAFLASLGAPAAVQPFDPNPMSTACTTNADCHNGQLCCYPCGIDGCSKICMNPVKGHCPLFV